MILIFSIESDTSTINVVKWLEYKKADFLVIFPEDIITIDEINISHDFFSIKSKKIYIDEVKSIWFRKWTKEIINVELFTNSYNDKVYNKSLNSELNAISNLLFQMLAKKYWLCNPSVSNLSKIEQYIYAKKNDLEIPYSTVTSKKTILLDLLKNRSIITKSIISTPNFIFEKDHFINYTTLLSEVNNYPDSFMPSLLQEKVEKEIEIRIFYLEKIFFSFAIIPSINDINEVDIRRVSEVNSGRIMKYNLPLKIKKKLTRFMEDINLNTGSIDLLKTENNKYVFLEVNPQGQFEYISNISNSNIDEQIANVLIKNDRK